MCGLSNAHRAGASTIMTRALDAQLTYFSRLLVEYCTALHCGLSEGLHKDAGRSFLDDANGQSQPWSSLTAAITSLLVESLTKETLARAW